jgi:hypothetical protein
MRSIPLAVLVATLLVPAPAAGQNGSPSNAAYQFLLGRELEAAGRIDEAIAAAREAGTPFAAAVDWTVEALTRVGVGTGAAAGTMR